MTEPGKHGIDDSLLDWHLDRLSDDDRAWLERELQKDVELRARSERLGEVLQPLDHWRTKPAQPNFADQVLARIQRARQVDVAAQPSAIPESGPPRRFSLLSLREVVAVAACILLLVGVFVPGMAELRYRSRRAACAGNLASIFRGTSAYQESFEGSLPFAGGLRNASWLPGGAKGRPYASNSRHVYLLVKWDYGPTPSDFICQASETCKPMTVEDRAAYDDFARACNISYASLNLAGPKPNVRPTMPVAYIGDTNPLFVGARFNASLDPDKANSPAHRSRGQNVLTLDGRADWMRRPIYGPNRDNIWLIGNIRQYTGIEVPVRYDDVQLVPGYPSTDPAVRRPTVD